MPAEEENATVTLENHVKVWKCPKCGKWRVEKLSRTSLYDEYVCMNIYCDFVQKD